MQQRPLPRVDEANLVLDGPGQVNVFLAVGMLTPGGFLRDDGIFDMRALRSALGRRVADLPELRSVPTTTGHVHRWVEAPPRLDEHVRTAAPLADMTALGQWCGSLMTTPLPLDRPLWELLIARFGEDHAVFVLRIHHAAADGASAIGLARRILDADPADGGAPAPSPSVSPQPRARASRLGRGMFRAVRTLLTRGVGETVLLGERGAHRGVAFVDADLDALRSASRRWDATVNDALLAAVAVGLRAAVVAAREPVPAALPVSVPVALQREGPSANQVGIMVVRLPLGEIPAHERMRRIAAQTRIERPRARAQGTLEFMRGPLGARMMRRLARSQHLVAAFVTNVRGPTERAGLAGAPISAIWPVAVIAGNVRVGVAALSYAGRLSCSVHFDAAHVDGHAVARAMREQFLVLEGLGRGGPPTAPE